MYKWDGLLPACRAMVQEQILHRLREQLVAEENKYSEKMTAVQSEQQSQLRKRDAKIAGLREEHERRINSLIEECAYWQEFSKSNEAGRSQADALREEVAKLREEMKISSSLFEMTNAKLDEVSQNEALLEAQLKDALAENSRVHAIRASAEDACVLESELSRLKQHLEEKTTEEQRLKQHLEEKANAERWLKEHLEEKQELLHQASCSEESLRKELQAALTAKESLLSEAIERVEEYAAACLQAESELKASRAAWDEERQSLLDAATATSAQVALLEAGRMSMSDRFSTEHDRILHLTESQGFLLESLESARAQKEAVLAEAVEHIEAAAERSAEDAARQRREWESEKAELILRIESLRSDLIANADELESARAEKESALEQKESALQEAVVRIEQERQEMLRMLEQVASLQGCWEREKAEYCAVIDAMRHQLASENQVIEPR